MNKMTDRETPRRAIEVLDECSDLMRRKGQAYNRVPQARYYPHGLRDIWVLMHQKMTRIESLLSEPGFNDFESLEDSARDLINYSAFFIEYSEGKMNGMTEEQLDGVGYYEKTEETPSRSEKENYGPQYNG